MGEVVLSQRLQQMCLQLKYENVNSLSKVPFPSDEQILASSSSNFGAESRPVVQITDAFVKINIAKTPRPVQPLARKEKLQTDDTQTDKVEDADAEATGTIQSSVEEPTVKTPTLKQVARKRKSRKQRAEAAKMFDTKSRRRNIH